MIEEKQALLDRVVGEDGWVFYTHDPKVAASKVKRDDKGKYAADGALERLA